MCRFVSRIGRYRFPRFDQYRACACRARFDLRNAIGDEFRSRSSRTSTDYATMQRRSTGLVETKRASSPPIRRIAIITATNRDRSIALSRYSRTLVQRVPEPFCFSSPDTVSPESFRLAAPVLLHAILPTIRPIFVRYLSLLFAPCKLTADSPDVVLQLTTVIETPFQSAAVPSRFYRVFIR